MLKTKQKRLEKLANECVSLLQVDAKMEIHVLKTATTFTMKCTNVTAIMDLSSVTMVIAALVSPFRDTTLLCGRNKSFRISVSWRQKFSSPIQYTVSPICVRC